RGRRPTRGSAAYGGPVQPASSPTASGRAAWCVLARAQGAATVLVDLDAPGTEIARRAFRPDALATEVSRREQTQHPRWVWSDTTPRYPRLPAAGVSAERAHAVRPSAPTLRASQVVRPSPAMRRRCLSRTPLAPPGAERGPAGTPSGPGGGSARAGGGPLDIAGALAEICWARWAR